MFILIHLLSRSISNIVFLQHCDLLLASCLFILSDTYKKDFPFCVNEAHNFCMLLQWMLLRIRRPWQNTNTSLRPIWNIDLQNVLGDYWYYYRFQHISFRVKSHLSNSMYWFPVFHLVINTYMSNSNKINPKTYNQCPI